MGTETVDIRFRSSGTRVVKRKIDQIGIAANNATRGIFLMKRALFVIGGAGLLRGLSRQLDLLTNFENRLKLTTTSSANLEEVQNKLFIAANNSRSSFEGVAEIYTRTALSVRQLGVSQKETLQFTESLAKATVISGASAREANAALIQLGQGLASNRLSGDELRSVLEQLPFVADVIAKHLKITRGELRQFGKDGKISAITVLNAFRGAREEIDKLFADTEATIGQALTVANNNLLSFIDNFDDATGASTKLAQAIIIVSQNIDKLVIGIIGIGIAILASFAGNKIAAMVNFVSVARQAAIKLAAINAAQVRGALASQARAAAQVADNKATIRGLTIKSADLKLRRTSLAVAAREAEFMVRNGVARNIQTGQFVNLNRAKANLIRTTNGLLIVENASLATSARLTTARGLQSGATNAAAAANARMAGAVAANNTITGRLAAKLPLLAGAFSIAGKASSGLATTLASNPYGLALLALTVLTTGIFTFGNEIKVTEDKVVGLKDATIAAFQLMIEAVTPFTNLAGVKISAAWDIAKEATFKFAVAVLEAISRMVKGMIAIIDFLPKVFVGVVEGIIAAWDTLPAAAQLAAQNFANFFIAGFELFANAGIKAINIIIRGINKFIAAIGGTALADALGFDGKIEEVATKTFTRITGAAEGSGANAAEAFGKGFSAGFEQSGPAQDLVDAAGRVGDRMGAAITDRARQNIKLANEDLAFSQGTGGSDTTRTKTPPGGGGGGSKGKNKKTFAEELRLIKERTSALALLGREHKILNGIIRIEKSLKRELTEGENALAEAALRSLEVAKTQAAIMDSIITPRQTIIEQQEALNLLFQEGRLGIEDYSTAMREMKIAADEASGTLFGGFRASIASSIMSAQQFGDAIGGTVVGAIDSAADAIVDFAKTGRLNLKALFADLFAQLLKIAAKQLLMRFVGNFLGFGGGGFGGGGGGFTLNGFATGGSILPTGAGSTDTQVIPIVKRPDERVDILTPGQQSDQRNNAGGGGTTIVQSPPVNVAAVLSPSDIAGAFDSDEGETVVINILQRNASTVSRIVGS